MANMPGGILTAALADYDRYRYEYEMQRDYQQQRQMVQQMAVAQSYGGGYNVTYQTMGPIAPPPSKPKVTQPSSNRAWLDKRVDEMRVRL